MNSSHSMTSPKQACAELERIQKDVWRQLASALPEPDTESMSEEGMEEYLKTNPDYTEGEITSFVNQQKEGRPKLNRTDISTFDYPITLTILTQRIDDLKSACVRFQPPIHLDNVCFGTIPGGGLDAYTFKVQGMEQYGVVIPNGLFNLVNLFCKLVVLLQPIMQTPGGLIYPPSASYMQLDLAAHPYIKFRKRDVLRAFFLRGDPEASLPYRSAIPFQDRFSYLLAGTELFVLAHEAAHILLGHLRHEEHGELTPELELEADSLALDIVTEYFNNFADYGHARATLSGYMFLALNRLWERTIHQALSKVGQKIKIASHPASEERFVHFVSQVQGRAKASTPPWYVFVHNAIAIATDDLIDSSLNDLLDEAEGIQGFSARVLPVAQAHMGHFRPVPEHQWWTTIAELLVSDEQESRRLGLWFLLQLKPESAVGLYDGLTNDDEAIQDLYKRALISIEPMYENYLPRLLQRFRETAREDQDFEYKYQIASYLTAIASNELGEEHTQGNPMHEGFFD